MDLPTPLALVLVIAGLWSLIVWPVFLKRVLKDPQARDANGAATRYMTTNLMMISTAMIFALATAVIGIRGLVG
ncbi:SCO4848 family membrane protein [Arthrobacter sp. 3Tela_A]|uniref:SCO4848 family membrane protein n=1 Tax=Arthrobacter sp. 3Tela_A TaxID=3093743 RepID=UPI003BB7D3A3